MSIGKGRAGEGLEVGDSGAGEAGSAPVGGELVAREIGARELGVGELVAREIGTRELGAGEVGGALPAGLFERFRTYASESWEPPPGNARVDQMAYGLAQPFLAVHLLARDRKMLTAGLMPAFLLAVFCALVAWVQEGLHFVRFITYFYKTFAVLAPLPPVVLASHYARLADTAHQSMGFGRSAALERGLMRNLWEAAAQAVIVAIAVAPVTLLLHLLPGVGTGLGAVVVAAWALHWIVVEALDNARVLEYSEDGFWVDQEEAQAPDPWFVRGFLRLTAWLPRGLKGLGRAFVSICDRLSFPWRVELAIVEGRPWLMAGFSLSTALLLALPVLNLLFRPIIVVAAAHLLGQLRSGIYFRPPRAPF